MIEPMVCWLNFKKEINTSNCVHTANLLKRQHVNRNYYCISESLAQLGDNYDARIYVQNMAK